MHSRQTIHLPSFGVSIKVHHLHPDPLQIEQRSFSEISRSCWGIRPDYTPLFSVAISANWGICRARQLLRFASLCSEAKARPRSRFPLLKPGPGAYTPASESN